MFDRSFGPEIPNLQVSCFMGVKEGNTLILGRLTGGNYVGEEALVFMNGASCFGIVLDDDARRFLRNHVV